MTREEIDAMDRDELKEVFEAHGGLPDDFNGLTLGQLRTIAKRMIFVEA